MFTILVCGGRDYTDFEKIHNALADLCDRKGLWDRPSSAAKRWVGKNALCVVTGGARGADTIAIEWALLNGAAFKVYEAEWDKYGLRAGPVRNQAMLQENKIDLVLAARGGAGTADMVRRAKKAGIEVKIIK